MYDPRYFVNVLEIITGDRPFVVHSGSWARSEATRALRGLDSAKVQFPRQTKEVDIRSALAIRFDRAFLDSIIGNDAFAASIAMRGEYIRQGKAEKLEIPGYSEVGQRARQARIASLPRLPSLLHNAVRAFRDQHSHLVTSLASLDVDAAESFEANSDTVGKLRAQQKDAAAKLAATGANEKSLLAIYERLVSERVPAEHDSGGRARLVGDSIRLLVDSLRSTSAARATLEAAVGKLREQLAQSVVASNQVRFEQQRATGVARVYTDASPELIALSDRITGLADTTLREVTASLLGRDASSLAALGQHLRKNLGDLASARQTLPPPGDRSYAAAIRQLAYLNSLVKEDLSRVAELDPQLLLDGSASAMVSTLVLTEFADATLAIPTGPLQPGDVVRLVVTATPFDHPTTREFSVHVRIQEFGLTRRIRDVSALIRRRGVDVRANEKAIETFLADKRKGELFVNDAVTYQPTIGVMMGWQWLPRVTNGGTALVRWLSPSFGIHISTPQFGARVYRIEQDSGDAKIDERKTAADIGVGAVMGLWDDRIVLSIGKAVTALDRRSYFGVGFSFISLVNGALSLNKTAP